MSTLLSLSQISQITIKVVGNGNFVGSTFTLVNPPYDISMTYTIVDATHLTLFINTNDGTFPSIITFTDSVSNYQIFINAQTALPANYAGTITSLTAVVTKA